MSDVPKNHRRLDILAYKEGLLDDAQRAELEAHLKECPECQATLAKVERFLPALQQALTPPVVSDQEMLARVRAEFAAKHGAPKPERVPFFARMRVGLIALTATAAGVAVLVLLPRGQTGGQLAQSAEDGGAGQGEKALAAPRPQPLEMDAGVDAGPPDRQ